MAATVSATLSASEGATQPLASNGTQSVPSHNSSLYVGDLTGEVTEAQLYELFSQVGPVASIRVCRDAVTRRSLGYAYVNYNSALDPQAADRALDSLNYTPLNGKPIRIMWSHRDPFLRKSGVGNIFIKNLDKSIDNKGLHDTFCAFGNILSCKVAVDGNGQSKGYGFVHFESEEAATLAIQKVNGMQLEDKVVYVGHFLKRQDRPHAKERFTNVYIKNLDTAVTTEELTVLVKEFGEPTSVVIMKDDEGNSRGFGFVNFQTADAASAAVNALHGKEVKTKKLWAGRAQKKIERQQLLQQKYDEIRQERIAKYQGMNLYIKNLVDDVDDDRLREEFSQWGTITSAKVMRDAAGKSKGFGFVCYTSHDEAARAVTEMNGKMLKTKPLYVALAQRKEVRRAQLEQQMAQRMAVNRPQAGPTPMPGMFPNSNVIYPTLLAGPGGLPQARPGNPNMMYQQMVPRGAMPPAGRGPRGMPGMMQQQNMMMMGNSGAAMMGGRGGRVGRGRQSQGRESIPGGRGRGFAQGRGAGRALQQQQPQQPPPIPAVPAPPAPATQPPAPQPPPVVPPVVQLPAAPAPPAAASGVVPGIDTAQVSLTTAMLAAAAPEQQKQMLGERLFPQVQRQQPDLAGKITGMLLEMDNSELLLLLESPEALTDKVNEAIQVLRTHNAIPDGVVIHDTK